MKFIINVFFIIIFLTIISQAFPQTQIYNPLGSVDTAWIRTYVSGLLAQDDEAYDIAVDDSGNTYVAGNIYNLQNGQDFCTIKYDRSGNQAWVRTYNSPGNSNDDVRAIAIDKWNNIYITGGTYDATGKSQFTTIKYSSAGEQVWVKHHTFPSTSGSYALDIAVDNSGNTFVIGDAFPLSGYCDIGTIKYNSSGDTVWTRRYNGPANKSDYARKLTVDRSGNVYVIGSSTGSTTNSDYVTIKYNSTGIQQWAPRYNNGATNGEDRPSAVAVDSSGNVYVTGETYTSSGYPDFATVKYNSAGTQQWVMTYNGPANMHDGPYDIGCDKSGNVFVTGYSYSASNSVNIFTLKYNSAGVKQWSARVDSGSTYAAVAKAISLDTLGNIYITGWKSTSDSGHNYATIKYDTNGVEQWIASYNGSASDDDACAIAVDNSGNVYVSGTSTQNTIDLLTIKYDQIGSEQWTARYDGPGLTDDQVVDVAVDNSGNAYVTGKSKTLTSDYDYLTMKYNSMGIVQWVARYNGPGNDDDEPVALKVDNEGNVIVTGSSRDSVKGDDITTIKYNNSGEEQWVVRYNGTRNISDQPYALAIDDSGNVYVTGQCYNTVTYDDMVTIKYNRDGIKQWASLYNGPTTSGDRGQAISLDNSGNVIVSGVTYGSGTSGDYTTIKYNNVGDTIWTRRYNSTTNGGESPAAIAIDGFGNIYVTGFSSGTSTYQDYATVKYSSSGVEEWVKRYNGPNNSDDVAKSIAVDGSGNVFVTGMSRGSVNFDYFTIKYSNSGDTIWTRRYNGTSNSDDYAYKLMVDNLGYVYVAGVSYNIATGGDYFTIKYTPYGVMEWSTKYSSAGNNTDEPMGMTMDGSGNVYVTGITSGNNLYYITTIKYIQGPNAVEPTDETIPKDFALHQNYPNPFNPSTTIQFDIPQASFVTLKVYNMLGQEVLTVLDDEKIAGRYDLRIDGSTLSSGVYFYRLVAGDPSPDKSGSGQVFVSTKKLLLLK